MLKLSVTPKAESDLTAIWLYTYEEWGAEQADKYLDHLEAGMKQLLSHPLLGADYAHVLVGYRRLYVEHHAVFYQVLKSEVLIVRVLHEDMDAPQRLLD
ncbi:type II toxin-antitoxin system RelE/ParE family toxin [Idiomarina loihiensis]|uniref:type II toxin-antitoxin system RelE/ParE family toxin n=1 Tax=Idiomarina TaxID=135575 RepID=UPI000302C8CE|nr:MULTISPECIES: type II toxin-antitoxin system RelE/ParE family toxin [Idiomarina]NWO03951.1 type II toxin-antitoxin system RelE/ParE family toxin [Idiomarinaceae bacterium]PWW34274.1 toxin ParE1/3/4 [Idiomarina loihiensis]TDO49521.1 toxin ParE1/3/4 [Idiomarina sp. 017G]TDP44654.1 toxin ParE1/3/4 [Idiomarina loihiensis]TDS20733.1 toxin ParE1/3/4 [Idiomarina sp. H2]